MGEPAVLGALEREVARVSTLLDSLTEEDWRAPTRCPPMDVTQMVAHMMRGAGRIDEMLTSGPLDAEPDKDGATYFHYDPAVAGGVVERAQADAAEYPGPSAVAHAFRENWARALAAARSDLATDERVYMTIFGGMRLGEYLRTRLVEVTVHHMDVRDALGRDPDPDPAALEGTADVLRDLLGTDPRRLGIPDVRFVLIGTGRAPLSDDEKEAFGPLADEFPLLA